jgi:hypothetical protein
MARARTGKGGPVHMLRQRTAAMIGAFCGQIRADWGRWADMCVPIPTSSQCFSDYQRSVLIGQAL